MNSLKIFAGIILLATMLGCASGSRIKSPQTDMQDPLDSKAYQHYFNGALLDFQDRYEQALIEYYQALLYDSSSAQIHKAIARNLMRLQYYESATKYLERSLSLDPENRETLNYLAEAHYNLKNYTSAIDYYNRLLEIDPYNTTVQNNLIYLYSQLKMDAKLLNFYKRMMTYYPDDSKFAIQYALANLKQKNTLEAERILEEVVARDSSEIEALLVLANLYEVKKDTAGAIRIYEKMLTLDSTNDEVLSRVYRLYRSSEQWDKLINLFTFILSENPDNSQVRLMLAESYFFKEDLDSAADVVKPVVDDSLYRTPALELLGRIAFEKEDFNEAEKHFTTLTEENPNNRFGWLFLTVIYNRQQKFNRSVRVLEQALSVHPDDTDLLSMYGSVLSQLGRDEEALKPLKKAVKKDSSDINTLSSLAAVYDKMKMYGKSDSLYAIALKNDPENALILNNYSYSLAQQGLQLEKALQMVNRALELDPENGAYLDTKGWIYYKMGNYRESLEFIQKALDSREESAEVLEHMGDVYFKLNNTEMAKKYWKQALEKDPNNEELARKIQNL
ncbi:MAG: tetratricopeptide repeat protein [Calditrichaeota bacterium]|nr:tetratricopeptide repeat protein [Calditrichota bacterium]RQW00509.1 MAG: tetratricopeptide repeat protein [Calditrichota bacterium]